MKIRVLIILLALAAVIAYGAAFFAASETAFSPGAAWNTPAALGQEDDRELFTNLSCPLFFIFTLYVLVILVSGRFCHSAAVFKKRPPVLAISIGGNSPCIYERRKPVIG